MKKRFLWIALISMAVTISVFGGFPIAKGVSFASTTTLNVDGDEVEISRDNFGVPHIFADTDRGLPFMYHQDKRHARTCRVLHRDDIGGLGGNGF